MEWGSRKSMISPTLHYSVTPFIQLAGGRLMSLGFRKKPIFSSSYFGSTYATIIPVKYY
jgi:hypothetical protein